MNKVWLLGFVLTVALFFAGCASSGSGSTGTSTRIGGHIDTGVQKQF
ncbi:MAG: hypothetical protein HZA90_25790 [Verrucomicrobia bacterium]|nr:hypothetical protein [Verrucomicrobiota bacterium]